MRWLMLHVPEEVYNLFPPSPLAPPKDSIYPYASWYASAAVLPGGEIIGNPVTDVQQLDLRYLAKTDSGSYYPTTWMLAPFELCLFLTLRKQLEPENLQAGYANWYKEHSLPNTRLNIITPLQLPVDVDRPILAIHALAYNQLINPEPVMFPTVADLNGRRLMLTNGALRIKMNRLREEFVRHFGDALFTERATDENHQQNEFIEYTSPTYHTRFLSIFEFRFVFKWGNGELLHHFGFTNFDAWEAIRAVKDALQYKNATRIRPFLPRRFFPFGSLYRRPSNPSAIEGLNQDGFSLAER
ncbi:hypothetical protein SPFM12_00303 [Salmonella phage SPFM12]|nr:hypothetical protein SPFM12_00303 [Salmonella phage SPFM12]